MFDDLIIVLRRLKNVIENDKLPANYNKLVGLIQQASSGTNLDIQSQIKQLKSQIRQTHDALSTQGWSYSQIQIFNRFGAGEIVGIKGRQQFDSAFSENPGVPSAVINELTQQSQKISQLLKNTNNVHFSLGSLTELDKPEGGKGIVQIVFKGEVPVDNLPDLHKQSATWDKIIRAYSLLAGESPENTKIISTNKVNPFFLYLATAVLVAKLISATVRPFLDLWHKVLQLQEAALILEKEKIVIEEKRLNLKKKNEEYENMKVIEEYENMKVKEILESVANTCIKEGLSSEKKHIVEEGKNNLLQFGPKMYEFIKAHGEIDVSQDGEKSPAASNLNFSSIYKQMYEIESRVNKLIEATNPTHDFMDEKMVSKTNRKK